MEKASFDRLNRVFEIAADERSCEMLLSAQNLRLVTQEPQPFVLNILPRRLPKNVVVGEHFILKDLPFYTAVRKADAQARKALLNEREEKRQEGTLLKAPGDKRSTPSPPIGSPTGKKKKVPTKGKTIKPPTPTKGVVIKSPAPTKGIIIRPTAPSDLPSVSSGSGHIACLNGSGPCRPPLGAPFFLSFFAAHLPVGGLFESQVLPPGWWLWNQLSGADGRMRKQQLLEDMQGIQSLLLEECVSVEE